LTSAKFAKAAGATVIATTSSNGKVKRLQELGADHVIDYSNDSEWGLTARKLTPDGQGVDHIVEVGGVGTLHQSVKAVKQEGVISVIGSVSTEQSATIPTMLDCWLSNFIARGVAVGSRAMMEEMVVAMEVNDIHPCVDENSFTLTEAKNAFVHFVSCRF
jgi:NADPH:quinone reductase-like Zn-dependent oxidoreductase